MRGKRKRVVTPAPRRPLPFDFDRVEAEVRASTFWTLKTSAPLDGRRRR